MVEIILTSFSLVAEISILAVFDMDINFNITSCNCKVKTSHTLPIESCQLFIILFISFIIPLFVYLNGWNEFHPT